MQYKKSIVDLEEFPSRNFVFPLHENLNLEDHKGYEKVPHEVLDIKTIWNRRINPWLTRRLPFNSRKLRI